MKNKKFAIGAALLMAGSLLLTNCTKNKTNEALSPDNEKNTSKEVSKLHWFAADIFDICLEACDKGQLSAVHNYSGSVVVSVGTNTFAHVAAGPPTIMGKVYTIVFNNTVGKDGHLRNGTLQFDYTPSPVVTATEPKHTQWIANVTATNFTIDDYSLTVTGMQIANTTPVGYPAPPYTPSVTSLSWKETGNISVSRTVGSGTNAVTTTNTWSGTLNMVLLNTFNQAVPTPTAGSITPTINLNPNGNTSPLQWQYAHISYDGTSTGTLDNGIGAFTSTITAATRNMNVSPETWYKDNVTNMLVSAEKHPFLTGTLTFKPGSHPTRVVDYGISTIVDYNAKVTIQGITYNVDCAEVNN